VQAVSSTWWGISTWNVWKSARPFSAPRLTRHKPGCSRWMTEKIGEDGHAERLGSRTANIPRAGGEDRRGEAGQSPGPPGVMGRRHAANQGVRHPRTTRQDERRMQNGQRRLPDEAGRQFSRQRWPASARCPDADLAKVLGTAPGKTGTRARQQEEGRRSQRGLAGSGTLPTTRSATSARPDRSEGA